MSRRNNIRIARAMKDITQTELARRMGIAPQTIQKYETGVISTIPFDKLQQIAEICEVSLLWLIGLDEHEISETSLSEEAVSVAKAYDLLSNDLKIAIKRILKFPDNFEE